MNVEINQSCIESNTIPKSREQYKLNDTVLLEHPPSIRHVDDWKVGMEIDVNLEYLE